MNIINALQWANLGQIPKKLPIITKEQELSMGADMLSPDSRNSENRPNQVVGSLSQYLKTKYHALKEGIGKIIEDLEIANQHPDLVNLEADLTESRRRQTELFTQIITEASQLEDDIDIIWQRYYQVIIDEQEENLARQMNAGNNIQLQALNLNKIEALNATIATSLPELQKQIARLDRMIQAIHQIIQETIVNLGNELIKAVGHDIFSIKIGDKDLNIDIHDVAVHVVEGLVKAETEGKLSAENLDQTIEALKTEVYSSECQKAGISDKEEEENRAVFLQWTQNHITSDFFNPLRSLFSIENQMKAQQQSLITTTAGLSSQKAASFTSSPTLFNHHDEPQDRNTIYSAPQPKYPTAPSAPSQAQASDHEDPKGPKQGP